MPVLPQKCLVGVMNLTLLIYDIVVEAGQKRADA